MFKTTRFAVLLFPLLFLFLFAGCGEAPTPRYPTQLDTKVEIATAPLHINIKGKDTAYVTTSVKLEINKATEAEELTEKADSIIQVVNAYFREKTIEELQIDNAIEVFSKELAQKLNDYFHFDPAIIDEVLLPDFLIYQ